MRWLVLCCWLFSGLALAQTVDLATLRGLQAAQNAEQKGELDKAVQQISALEPEAGSYAQALVWRTHGYLVWQLEHLQHAEQLLAQAYTSGLLGEQERQQDALSLAQLNTQLERPRKALEYLATLPESRDNLSLAIYNWQALNRYDKALPLAEKYLRGQTSISDQWLRFMVAANAELKRYSAAQQWQQQLLARYPQQVDSWRQLAALQQMAGAYAQAFATLRTAYQQGLDFNHSELDQLVAMASAADQPWQGARLLSSLLQSEHLPATATRLERLAQLQWQARERSAALQDYQRLAKQTGEAKHWLIVVQLASEQEQWQQARQALQAASRSGASRKDVSSWQDWLDVMDS